MEEEKSRTIPVQGGEGAPDEKALETLTREDLIESCREFREKADRNYDLYLRSMAEMENMKKRTAKEKEEWVKYANENLIKSILPVIDNLEKALTHTREENSLHALREGVELTLRGLKDNLVKTGVQEVKAPGVPFDPRFHEAVFQVEDDQTPSGIVVQELQKGYTLNGRLIRPAMVVVSKGRGTAEEEKREEIPRGSVC